MPANYGTETATWPTLAAPGATGVVVSVDNTLTFLADGVVTSPARGRMVGYLLGQAQRRIAFFEPAGKASRLRGPPGTNLNQPHYRSDIDGLRAIAVLPVVWFHSGLPGLPGGFAGVDVFFVISGFLIAGIVNREQAAGTFKFAQFYQRRFRRIAPALVAMIVATLAAGYALLLPEQLVTLVKSALAALAMVPNVFFWSEGNGGYFGLTKRVSPPLLHTWSLGVEEQFYLLFPLFFVLAHRFRVTLLALGAVTLGSFALCVLAGARSPQSAFYMLPMRAWELGLGAMLAIGPLTIPSRFHKVCSVVAAALLAIGYAWLKGSAPLIGLLVAIPALGAVLLIASGAAAPANRLLALPAPVWLGRISYSLYLWHWPVFIYLRQWQGGGQLAPTWAVAGIVLSVTLAWLSYLLIELPARRADADFLKVVIAVGASAAMVLASAIVVIAARGLPTRFSPEVIMRANQAQDFSARARRCIGIPLGEVDSLCRFGQGPPTLAVWGDSHAAAEIDGIAAGLERSAVLFSMGGCPPDLAQKLISNRCDEHNRAIGQWLARRPGITTVVLAAYWDSYGKGKEGPQMWRGVQAVVASLPNRHVVVLAGVPQPRADVPFTSAMRERYGRPPMRWPCPSARVPVTGATVVDLSAAFCSYPEQWRLFTDGNHASLTAGREVIAPMLRRALPEGAAGAVPIP